jgi:hypothetical protein
LFAKLAQVSIVVLAFTTLVVAFQVASLFSEGGRPSYDLRRVVY